eukprot:scaffold43228_cov71-Attheya_sp.AAC.3
MACSNNDASLSYLGMLLFHMQSADGPEYIDRLIKLGNQGIVQTSPFSAFRLQENSPLRAILHYDHDFGLTLEPKVSLTWFWNWKSPLYMCRVDY